MNTWTARLSGFVVAALACVSQPGAGQDLLRIGISHGSFGMLQRNDVDAALKAWASAVMKARKIDCEVQVEVFAGRAELRAALENGAVDAASMSAEEFTVAGIDPEFLYLPTRNDSPALAYVLLAHKAGGIRNIGDLKGRSLARHSSPLMGPAVAWLESEGAKVGLESVEKLIAQLMPIESASKAILRAFFRQSDACLTTRSAFEVACEMNPQLKRDLAIVAQSPPVIPGVFFFNPGYASRMKQEVENAVLELHTTTAGQQVLMVFQSSRMRKVPLEVFEPTRRLLSGACGNLETATAPAVVLGSELMANP